MTMTNTPATNKPAMNKASSVSRIAMCLALAGLMAAPVAFRSPPSLKRRPPLRPCAPPPCRTSPTSPNR